VAVSDVKRLVLDYDPYIRCRPDAIGKLDFTSYQKCFAAIRMLEYGVSGDLLDEYLQMSETTCLEEMYRLCRAVIVVFGYLYLREKTIVGTARLLSIEEGRGFPGMIRSIDFMH
jgi:hypothetical protein